MPQYKAAHIPVLGLIIVPLEPSFGGTAKDQQNKFVRELQDSARLARIAGMVVPVWDNNGSLGFIAPPIWRRYLAGLSLTKVQGMLNRELFC